MVKNLKVFTMFGAILILMLLSLTNLHAAGLNWGSTDFTYSAEVYADSFRPEMDLGSHEGGAVLYTSTSSEPLGSIDSEANVTISSLTGAATVNLSAGAWGDGTSIVNGASASAFVSFNVTDLTDTEALSASGSARSWITKKVTVNSAGFYDLHGIFTGTIGFSSFYNNPFYYATSSYTGTVKLQEFVNIPGNGLMLSSTNELSIDDMISGANIIENIWMRPFDNDGNFIYYNLSTDIGDLDINISNLMMMTIRAGDLGNLYELGNEADPFVIEGWLVESVPVPGTLLLLFSGVTGLFGFQLSRRRCGSSNR